MYRRLYEQVVCIVEDFFDDPKKPAKADYPPPLFTCAEAQATFILKPGISRETIFDGVKRSGTSCGYDTNIVAEKKPQNKRKKADVGPRQQWKPCKVDPQISLTLPTVHNPIFLYHEGERG